MTQTCFKRICTAAAMLIAIGLLPATGRSDSILLKDGRILEGEVVKGDMTSDAIVFRANVVGIWTTMTFKPAEITALDVVDGDQSDRGTPSSTGSGTGTSSPAASEPAGTTEDGIRTVRVTGEGVTKALALHDACRNAVEQVTGTLILSESQIEDGELIEDKIIAFSNGKVDDFEIVESTKASDNSWSITIDANVLVMKLIEELRVNNVTLKANVGSEAMSQLGEVVSREERDHTAAKTIKELMQYYPQCIWTVEPAGKLRTQANRTSGGEFIVAHKVRFEITTAKWNRFANAFKRLLGEVALDKKTVRLNTPRVTGAEKDRNVIAEGTGSIDFFSIPSFVAELQNPVEQRQRIADLPNRLGRMSIGTTVKDLRKMKPLHTGKLTGESGSSYASETFKIGFHDTVTVIDRKIREARVYAVPSNVFDEIEQRLNVIEIYPSMINADGDDVGRSLHSREDCLLSCNSRSSKWDRKQYSDFYFDSRTIAVRHTKENPRQLVIIPFARFGAYSYCTWMTDTVYIEYPFAMTEEDMTAENLSFQVELVDFTDQHDEQNSNQREMGSGAPAAPAAPRGRRGPRSPRTP